MKKEKKIISVNPSRNQKKVDMFKQMLYMAFGQHF